MLMRIPGSVAVISAVPKTPEGFAVPEPVILRLMHCG